MCVCFLAVQISGVELVIFLLQHDPNHLYDQEKVVMLGDCCYVNPMVRRTFRFLGNPMTDSLKATEEDRKT